MIDQDRLQTALRAFTHTLVRHYDVRDVLQRLSEDVAEILDVAGCGLSILDGERLLPVAATTPLVTRAEQLQVDLREGPCVDAAELSKPVVVTELDEERHRWPSFAPAAAGLGVTAVLGMPLHVDGAGVGALAVWATRPRAWSDDDVDVARLLADMATSYAIMVSELRTAEDLEQTHAGLKRLYDRTVRLDRLRSRLFAAVSQELRTPLTLILGPAEQLAESTLLPADARDHAAVIRRNARVLRRLIDDLLTAAAIESSEADLAYVEVDLVDLVRLSVAHFDTVAADRRITVTVDVPERLVVQVDAQRIGRSILNVVANAFQFTPAGGAVDVAVRHLEAEDRAIVTVSDSGPGIPEDDWEMVFEQFVQAGGGRTTRLSGTGLGLSIARELVRLHRGTVTVGHAPQGGALFTVELPVAAPPHVTVRSAPQELQAVIDEMDPQAVFALPDETHEDELDRPLVLVIEGNVDMNRYLRQILGDRYRVAAAHTGGEGLELARELRPDLILCAIMVPEMSGEGLLGEIRSDDDVADTPFIVVTGRSDDAQRVRMLRGGATDFLLKPFVVEELRARVAKALADHLEARQLRTSEASAHATAEQLQRALRSRVVIEQAKGVVATQLGVGVEDAFHVLRAHARRQNVRLHDVADAVVNLGLRPTTDE
jgi:signal transduction histidine kinase/DNA-binding response OmpR family regulator